MSPLPSQAGAAIAGRSFDLTARVTRRPDDDGVLYAVGTRNAGMSVFVQDRRLVLDYNAFGERTVIESAHELPEGDATLGVHLRRGDGMSGSAWISVDGDEAGSADLPLFMRAMSSVGPSLAADHGSAVSPRYRAPFPFTGTLHELVIQVSPERAHGVAEATARAEMDRQ